MKNESCHSFGDLISLGYKEKRNPYVAGVIPPLGWELYQAGEVNNLPPEIINNKKLVEQVSLRKDLHQLFDRVFQAIPNPTINIEEAAKEGLTDEYTVRELWDGVTDFLEQDENNVRILLYLPFELLPNPSSLDKLSKQTAESGSRLLDVYKWGWIRLLHQVESRANFIDGDVLEPGLGEPERISKAGHFIPELIKRGIVSYDDICLLLESIKNEDLLRSVAEGATVAIENGLLDKISSDEIKAIIEEKVGKVLAPSTRQNRSFFDYHSSIISPERAAWLRLVEMNEINENESDILAQEIICDASFKRINLEGKSREVVARGIIKAGKLLASE
ncbi:MAG: hypothetical protein P8Y06_02340, partial [Patescibacteria group bacterium]